MSVTTNNSRDFSKFSLEVVLWSILLVAWIGADLSCEYLSYTSSKYMSWNFSSITILTHINIFLHSPFVFSSTKRRSSNGSISVMVFVLYPYRIACQLTPLSRLYQHQRSLGSRLCLLGTYTLSFSLKMSIYYQETLTHEMNINM